MVLLGLIALRGLIELICTLYVLLANLDFLGPTTLPAFAGFGASTEAKDSLIFHIFLCFFYFLNNKNSVFKPQYVTFPPGQILDFSEMNILLITRTFKKVLWSLEEHKLLNIENMTSIYSTVQL